MPLSLLKYYLPLIFCILSPILALGQQKQIGKVINARTHEPVPFATIKFGNGNQGVIAGLDGTFEIPMKIPNIKIEVSCLGYLPVNIDTLNHLIIYLEENNNSLTEIVVKPQTEKIRRIIEQTIQNRKYNNPDNYDWYRCHVYYKMISDISLSDSAMADTSAKNRKLIDLIKNQHILMSESHSIRTWEKPNHLQEEVLASRFSGFKKTVFASLVTDVLPFHTYNDYITLNGKDYHNPISKGCFTHYKYYLNEEILSGNDTTWILSFKPKSLKADVLSGKVYINSNGYAISQIVARANDTILKMDVRIEQQYEKSNTKNGLTRWFPHQINYVIDWTQMNKKSNYTIHIKGNSQIDSLNYDKNEGFNFDKSHTVLIEPEAISLSDSEWANFRPHPLSNKEIRTYRVIDSLGKKSHLDKIVKVTSKMALSKLPTGLFNWDISRLYSYNAYEGSRLGAGLETNERLLKHVSLGGWAGYGCGDKLWKYGGYAEIYFDKHREFSFKFGYDKDLNDPGRIHMHKDLDKNYLNYYLLQRVDETREYYGLIKKKLGYWNLELAGKEQEILSKYNYALEYNGKDYTTFNAREASLNLRYAYAERTAPVFGTYFRLKSIYPIGYGKITMGQIENGDYKANYTQALAALSWKKHINRLGNTHLLVEGGKVWSDAQLPLSKLFAGNGYKYDGKSGLDGSLYTFGGMMTIYPYDYYSDGFVNLILRHDFDWKLYRLEKPGNILSSVPFIGLQYNMLYGTMKYREYQKLVNFTVPDNAYNEAGILLNNLLRLRLGNLYYLTTNLGYFYHIDPTFPKYSDKNGKVVFGVGVEL